jgi:phosphate transport system permease protein
MSTASTALQDGAPSDRLGITSRRMPRWSPALLALAAIALGIAIGAGAGLRSHLQWGLIAVVLFVLGTFTVAAAVEGRRQAKDRLATSLVWAAFILAVIPLFGLVYYTIAQGAHVINADFLTHSMKGVLATDANGGVYAALIGTLEQVGIAAIIATPLGILTAIYLVEYGRGRLARAVTFFVDVMTGVPSIVAGLFVLSFWIILLNQSFTGFAGSIALAILMLPTVVRSTEEMLRLVPTSLREASLALGVPKWLTIMRVVVPTALGGIATGLMLAVARIAGETAPMVLLVFGFDAINSNPFKGAQSDLPLFVYQQYALGTSQSEARAWGGALVLIAVVMALNLVARGIARWKAPKAGR